MNVYRTHRSASYPCFVYQAFERNAAAAELITEGLGGVENADIGSPFPRPRNGLEALWNHTLRWRGLYVTRFQNRAAVTRRFGLFQLVTILEELAFPYGWPDESPIKDRFPGLHLAARQKFLAPSALSGFAQLVMSSYNYEAQARRTWIYEPNLRKVFTTPFAGFDNPAPHTDALRTADESDLYNGSPALFEWELLGKREMYIPYNAYRLHSGDVSPGKMLQKKHIDPNLARYELHRVWVIEGRVKSASRNRTSPDPAKRGHIYGRRVFYLDEDSWQIAVTDNYDNQGQLWRLREGHMINYYEVPVPWYTLQLFYDLQEKRYLVEGLDNAFPPPRFSAEGNPLKFSPTALDFYVR
jgi:hypothetical protein